MILLRSLISAEINKKKSIQKIWEPAGVLTLEITIFGFLKMMVKKSLEIFILKFHRVAAAQRGFYWPGRLAGISEGESGISKYFFF